MPEENKPIGARDVEVMFQRHVSEPDYQPTYEELRNLLTIASRFFETHNDDGTAKLEPLVYTPQEMREMLGIDQRQLKKLLDAGQIPGYRPEIKRFAKRCVDEWMLREKLAKFIHEDIWAHWMEYLFSLTKRIKFSSESGEVADIFDCIPGPASERWKRQMGTAYEELPENEQKSDLELADKLIKLLEE